ncbi:MAG: MtnX-like HAD-IB family phosphatase [Candidatus Bathyarchaeota archaeon]|nr:MtnX-like HAD-IB family phosphatase [Candidatus Bathyarchaeota archaeon]
MDLAVLCDFDGTIANIDTAVFVLDRFGQGDWRALNKQYELGQITLEECLRRQFSRVVATQEEILDELDKAVTFRPNFEGLVRYCQKKSIPFVIVSAGLDFVINYFLRQKDWDELVETCTPKTQFKANGIDFVFPKLSSQTSANFKQDQVRLYRAQGKKVIYIGDGAADYAAAITADYPFAVKGSRLAKLCETQRQGCSVMTDFKKVAETIRRITT